MKKTILIIASLLFISYDIYAQSLLVKSFVARKINNNELVLKFKLVNTGAGEIYLFANNIYYSSSTTSTFMRTGYPSEKFMFTSLNWTLIDDGNTNATEVWGHSPRLANFPKCIRILRGASQYIEIHYKNDPNTAMIEDKKNMELNQDFRMRPPQIGKI